MLVTIIMFVCVCYSRSHYGEIETILKAGCNLVQQQPAGVNGGRVECSPSVAGGSSTPATQTCDIDIYSPCLGLGGGSVILLCTPTCTCTYSVQQLKPARALGRGIVGCWCSNLITVTRG